MGFPKYQDYKTTEIELAPNVPKHWNIRKLKFMASVQNGRDYKHVESDEGYDVIGSGGAFVKASEYLYSGESVLLGRKGTIDKPLYVNDKFWTVDTMFYTVIHEDTVAKYLYYCAKILPFKYLSTQTALPSVTQFALENFYITYPDKKEQRKISDFLDHKTRQIDQLIEKKKALIEKLDERRIAIITQAVTKGIDKNAKMKPSGVGWLGDIPDHWEVRRLRFCLNTNPVKSEVNKMEGDTPVSFVPMDSVNEYGGMDASITKPLAEVYNGYTYFIENDVVLAKITPCFENGKGSLATGLNNGLGFGTTEFHVLRSTGKMDADYIFLLTISHAFRDIGASEMLGAGGQKRIPEDFIKDFRLGIPNIEEQRDIVEHINTQIDRIDKMKRVSVQVISLYEEYRSALITSAVTGKIDVRNIQLSQGEQL